jgi:hypothetical protein
MDDLAPETPIYVESVFSEQPPELQADRAELATIRNTARKLPRDNVVRQTAERILGDLAGEAFTARHLRKAAVERSGFRWRERFLAAWCLGLTRVPEEERTETIEALGLLADNKLESDNGGAFWRLQYRTALITVPVILAAGGLEAVVGSFSVWDILQAALRNLGTSVVILPFSSMLEKRRLNLARAAAVLSLGRLSAPEATGLVAATLYDGSGEGSGEVKRASERALPSVLRALSFQHLGQVRRTSIDHLCRVLADKRAPLVMAALDALEKVGGGTAVDPVKRLQKKTRSAKLRQRALEVMPVLEARRRDEQAPKMLLRATATPGALDEILLRPTNPNPESDPDVLLRPTSADSEEESDRIRTESRSG